MGSDALKATILDRGHSTEASRGVERHFAAQGTGRRQPEAEPEAAGGRAGGSARAQRGGSRKAAGSSRRQPEAEPEAAGSSETSRKAAIRQQESSEAAAESQSA